MAIDTLGNIKLSMGFLSNHSLFAGETGSGKSYAGGVVCEELSKMNIPFIFIDTQGANKGLIRLPDTKIVDPNKIKPKKAGAIVSNSNVNAIIIKPKKMMMPAYRSYCNDFLRNYLLREQKAVRILFLDEAHLHCPRNANTEDSEILKNIATSYRAEGFFLYSITQRLVEISKTIENESLNLYFFRLSGFNDLQRLRDILRLKFPKENAEALIEQVRTFDRGTCMLLTHEKIGAGDKTPKITPQKSEDATAAKTKSIVKIEAEEKVD